jgi:hypothetical protein
VRVFFVVVIMVYVFQAVVDDVISFISSIDGNIQLPTQNTNKNNTAKLAEELRERITKDIGENCNYFSCTSDLWSSHTMDAFMALTLQLIPRIKN